MQKRERIKIKEAVAINDEVILTEGDEVIVVRNVDEEPEEEEQAAVEESTENGADEESVEEEAIEEETPEVEEAQSSFREKLAKVREQRRNRQNQ